MANLSSNHPCEGEDSEDENEELQQIDTLITTVGKVTYKDKLYSRKNKVGTGKFVLTVETEEALAEIVGPLGMEHNIITNARALREFGTLLKLENWELKKIVVRQEMIDKEVRAANLIVEDIKKQVDLNTGIIALKQGWTKNLIEAIKALHSSMVNFYIEEEGLHSQAEKIDQLIIRWKNGYPTMLDLRRRATHHPFMLDFCIDWFQLYDYLFYIKAKSTDFICTSTQLKAVISEQAREYEFQVPLFEETDNIKEYMTMMTMIHATIAKQICSEDPHSLKTGKQMTEG